MRIAINRRFMFVLLILVNTATPGNGQTVNFRKYTDTVNRFSLSLPSRWRMRYSESRSALVCVPTGSKERLAYQDCFETIIFSLEIFRTGLDSTLLKDGVYWKKGNIFYTTDRFDTVTAKNLSGSNWTGIYHKNVCGINCKSSGFHAAAGECEFIYCSKDNLTVLIETNGRAFDQKVLEKIIRSFRFDP